MTLRINVHDQHIPPTASVQEALGSIKIGEGYLLPADGVAVALIDLDFFKSVNDRHGHDAGDSLLTAFGTLLARRVRKSYVACRYGGEEFCLLMPRTEARAAARKVATLLRQWRSVRFEFGDETLERLSFSAGVSDTLHCGESPERLVKAADEALLAAKASGRNRVHVAPEAATLSV